MQIDELRTVAERLQRSHLKIPAILFLEMHKPLAGIARESFAVSAPLVGLLFGGDTAQTIKNLLSDPNSIESLIRLLEES